MEKKIYIMQNLGCANCAAKMEAKFNALPEVEEATITFATKQLRLTAENPDSLIEKLTQIAQTVEHEVVIVPRDTHAKKHECGCGHHHEEHHHECNCGHHHEEHHHECGCGHHHEEHHHDHSHGGDDKKTIFLGAGLFGIGLVLNLIGLNIGGALAFVLGYLILGREVLTVAWKNLTRGHVLDENFLMSIATIGAFCIGEFPEAVGVMLFYRVGEYFEHRAVERSRSQIMEAVDLRPEVVNLLEEGKVTVIAAEEVNKLMDISVIVLILPGKGQQTVLGQTGNGTMVAKFF